MKKKILSFALIAATTAAGYALSEYKVMNIHKSDNTVITVKVDEVDKITFETKNVALTNQYDKNGDVTAIGSVVESIGAEGRTYYVYDESGVTTTADPAAIKIWVAESNIGKALDLATATADDYKIEASGMTVDAASLEGSLKVSKDKFNKNVTIALESTWTGESVLRAKYTGAFASVREASNTFSITFDDGYTENGAIAPMVEVAKDGSSYGFGFGSVENAAAPEDYRSGNYGIRFYVPAGWTSGTTYDIAADANKGNLTFEVFYYPGTQTITIDDTATGTICVLKNADGSYYFNYEIVFDGVTFKGDYSGTPKSVDSLEDMAPATDEPNQMVITTPSGYKMGDFTITSVQHRVDTDGQHYFYFMHDDYAPDNKSYIAQLMLCPTFATTSGKYDLTTQEANTWCLYYSDFALGATGSYKWYVPTQGEMKISIDGDTYEFTISVKNTYKSPWGSGTAGSGNDMQLHFKGALSDYTGTSANTLK